MKFLGSDAKPVQVSAKQVSPNQEPVKSKEPKRGYNLYTAPALVLAKKLDNKREHCRQTGTEFSIGTSTLALMELINKTAGKCGYTNQYFLDPSDVTILNSVPV